MAHHHEIPSQNKSVEKTAIHARSPIHIIKLLARSYQTIVCLVKETIVINPLFLHKLHFQYLASEFFSHF